MTVTQLERHKNAKWFDVPYAHTRTIDGVEQQMIEVERGCYVNAAAAIGLGLLRNNQISVAA